MPSKYIISIHSSKKSVYIFCKDGTCIDCKNIYEECLVYLQNQKHNTKSNQEIYQESNTNTNTQTHITFDEIQTYKFYVYLDSTLLLGGTESINPYNECFFGALDSNNTMGLDDTKPIYQLIGTTDYVSKDSKESLTQTLQIFLNGSTLTLLNYSLIDSSLNIKLKCNSSKSKTIAKKEQTQREQKKQDSKTQDFIQSSSMLHPILEDSEIKCPHNGVVKLKSNKGKPFTSKGIPMVLESDLLNSSIIGCTNNIAGIPTPCSFVSVILPNARGLKKFNDDYPIMQDLVSSGVLSDKGFPLVCTKKPNNFKINSPNPSNVNTQDKESLASSIDTAISSLFIITSYKDLEEYYFTPSFYENRQSKEQYIISQSGFYTPKDTLDIKLPPLLKNTDYVTLDSNNTLAYILQDISDTYTPTFFSYRIFTLRIAYTLYEYILVIPKGISKFIDKLLKDKREKEDLGYGYGRFIDLQRDYVRNIENTQDEITLLHIQGKVLLTPSGCERMRVSVV